MKTQMIALVLLALTACSKSDNANEATAAPAVPVEPIQPGLYRQATTLLEIKDPALSGAEAEAAAKAIGTTQTADRCVTPEMIANPGKMISQNAAKGCTVKKSVWDGGKIDIAMTCPETADNAGEAMSLNGTYDASSYKMNMATTGNNGEVMRMKVEAKRLGDCAK